MFIILFFELFLESFDQLTNHTLCCFYVLHGFYCERFPTRWRRKWRNLPSQSDPCFHRCGPIAGRDFSTETNSILLRHEYVRFVIVFVASLVKFLFIFCSYLTSTEISFTFNMKIIYFECFIKKNLIIFVLIKILSRSKIYFSVTSKL